MACYLCNPHRTHFLELFNSDSIQHTSVEMEVTNQRKFTDIIKAIPSFLNMKLVEKDDNSFAAFYGKHCNGQEIVMYISYEVSLTGSYSHVTVPTAFLQHNITKAKIRGNQEELVTRVSQDINKLFETE